MLYSSFRISYTPSRSTGRSRLAPPLELYGPSTPCTQLISCSSTLSSKRLSGGRIACAGVPSSWRLGCEGRALASCGWRWCWNRSVLQDFLGVPRCRRACRVRSHEHWSAWAAAVGSKVDFPNWVWQPVHVYLRVPVPSTSWWPPR